MLEKKDEQMSFPSQGLIFSALPFSEDIAKRGHIFDFLGNLVEFLSSRKLNGSATGNRTRV